MGPSWLPEAYKNILSLQKEIKVLDMLASPLFVISTEIHTVEQAVDLHLWVTVEAWEPKSDSGLQDIF